MAPPTLSSDWLQTPVYSSWSSRRRRDRRRLNECGQRWWCRCLGPGSSEETCRAWSRAGRGLTGSRPARAPVWWRSPSDPTCRRTRRPPRGRERGPGSPTPTWREEHISLMFSSFSREKARELLKNVTSHLMSQWPTWIRSNKWRFACSSFLCLHSSSLTLCCSRCSIRMWSTEAFRMVPLFQRMSLGWTGVRVSWPADQLTSWRRQQRLLYGHLVSFKRTRLKDTRCPWTFAIRTGAFTAGLTDRLIWGWGCPALWCDR